ncbi:MAG: aminopeptidase P family protein [Deltaproteobacteria bacterium]|nr:aminopeptidase P family protein [Deltaproteobacteria bacterium]
MENKDRESHRITQKGRIAALQEGIGAKGWGGVLLFYSRDIFYYTGTARPAYLLVTPTEYLLFIRSGFDLALDDVFIEEERVVEERYLDSLAQETLPMIKESQIGTELDLLPANQFFQWKEIFKGCEWVDASPLILAQRRRKDPLEIKLMKRACEAQDAGHRALLNQLRPGITELELAAAVEHAQRLAGHEGVFFMRRPDFFMSHGPIASGKNLSRFSGVVHSVTGIGLSTAVPVGPSRKRIEKGDIVVVDIPTLTGGYHADQTRTYCLGKATPKAKALHNALLGIWEHVNAHARPGIRCSDLFVMAENRAEEYGAGDAFLSFGKGKRGHMIGHGIGLECTEPPVISKTDHSFLRENDVMAVEIHMFQEGVGVVKIEDMLHVGADKNDILTKSPRRLFEVVS